MFGAATNLAHALKPTVDWTVSSFGAGEFWLGVLACALVIPLIRALLLRRHHVAKVSINLPFNLGNIEYEPTDLDRALAWKLYVQLKTRKAALMFDDDNDVIAEVHDSLHDIFPTTRDLLAHVPLPEAAKRDGVAQLMLRVLNDGLRPHLTKWGASYRRWWEQAENDPDNKNKTPQEIQRGYPDYSVLVKELKAMNTELNKYAEDLLAIVRAPTRRLQRLDKGRDIVPEQPPESAPLEEQTSPELCSVERTVCPRSEIE